MEYQKTRLDILIKNKKKKMISKEEDHQYQIQNSFVFDSSDKYIKKILIQNKWRVIPGQSKMFTLKWIYMPKSHNFNQLTQNQRINHFPHTHVLTTKLGLKRTLTAQRSALLGWNGQYHGHFFPRSYDLSQQMDSFERDFNRTAISNLAKKMMIAIELQANNIFHHLSKNILKKIKPDKNWLLEVRKILDQNMMWENDPEILKQCHLRVNSSIFEPLLCFLSIFFTLDTHLSENDFSQKEILQLVQYSHHNPPYSSLELHYQGNKSLARLPSLSALRLFFKLYKKCYQSWSWFKADGLRNIWVVKTSDSSRGRSIFLVQSLEEAQSLNNGMRLVQKYIEDVWIYRPNLKLKQTSDIRKLENRKFDIRLWVVVKSFVPLQAYIYEEGYLRISQNKYQLLDISSEKSHLTNFSVNWTRSEDTQDSYLLLSHFLSFIDSNQIKSAQILRKEIYDIISQTLYSAEQITHSGDPRCFQLFGFDIILDGDLRPWILQCNMSPACQQRGILSKVVQQMGAGLLSLIGITLKHPCQRMWQKITPSEYISIQKHKYLNKCLKENYQKDHHKSQNLIKQLKIYSVLNAEQNILGQQSRINSVLPAISKSYHYDDKPLMIVGRKISKSALSKLDNYYRLLESTIKIQIFARYLYSKRKNQSLNSYNYSCLKLIQWLAKIVKKGKGKYLRLFRRRYKKIQKDRRQKMN